MLAAYNLVQINNSDRNAVAPQQFNGAEFAARRLSTGVPV